MGGEVGLVIVYLVYFLCIVVFYTFFTRNAEEEKCKWGSMIAAIVFLFIFLMFCFYASCVNDAFILLILSFPVIVYLLYKERTENIKYGFVWILLPVLVALLGYGLNFTDSTFYWDFFVIFCMFAIPAFIIDVIYIYNIKTLIGLYLSFMILFAIPFFSLTISIQPDCSASLGFLSLLFLIAFIYMLIFGLEKVEKIRKSPKWGSLKAAYMLLFLFWGGGMYLISTENMIFPMSEFRLIPLFIVIIFGFPVTIHLLYKERTENIKYGFAWILFPLLAVLVDLWCWVPDRMAKFDPKGSWAPGNIFILFLIFVLPAFIIDVVYVHKTKITAWIAAKIAEKAYHEDYQQETKKEIPFAIKIHAFIFAVVLSFQLVLGVLEATAPGPYANPARLIVWLIIGFIFFVLYEQLIYERMNWARITIGILTIPLGLILLLSEEARLYCLKNRKNLE